MATESQNTDPLLTLALGSMLWQLGLGNRKRKKNQGALDKEWHHCPMSNAY